jgi:hypothetical protein
VGVSSYGKIVREGKKLKRKKPLQKGLSLLFVLPPVLHSNKGSVP